MKLLTFRPEFADDLFEAASWYEDQRVGLGETFLKSVDTTIASLHENPRLYPKEYGNLRRALVKRYPFGIYFYDDPDEVIVVAVWHLSREPDGWQKRI